MVRWLGWTVLAGCGVSEIPPEGSLLMDGEPLTLEACGLRGCTEAAPCGGGTTRVDLANAFRLNTAEGVLELYSPEDDHDVSASGVCLAWEQRTDPVLGPPVVIDECVSTSFEAVEFEDCWSGTYEVVRDGPADWYAILDVTLDCSTAEGRALTGSLYCADGNVP